ncbi:hypothetical protein SCHPADRAFT_947644 [Schizopora paradoxa]|uniref:Ribonuclease H1 N-terminal domain-containing protein n=1 Tax=Schizopora paradoxa TaxID=27342 RepID=A0A0H2R4Y7_9AGAM|nr:hypothetical protein SCHPADRAFT_947644 [Schizopora paradoxa]
MNTNRRRAPADDPPPPPRNNQSATPALDYVERGLIRFVTLFITLVFRVLWASNSNRQSMMGSAYGSRADDLERMVADLTDLSFEDDFYFPPEPSASQASGGGLSVQTAVGASGSSAAGGSSPSKGKGTQKVEPPQNAPSYIAPPPPAGQTGGRWYVVIVGLRTGIFTSWAEAGPYTQHQSGAVHCAFDNYQEAYNEFQSALLQGRVQTLPDIHGVLRNMMPRGG